MFNKPVPYEGTVQTPPMQQQCPSLSSRQSHLKPIPCGGSISSPMGAMPTAMMTADSPLVKKEVPEEKEPLKGNGTSLPVPMWDSQRRRNPTEAPEVKCQFLEEK